MLMPFTNYSEIRIFKWVVSCTALSAIKAIYTIQIISIKSKPLLFLFPYLLYHANMTKRAVYIELLPIDISFLASFIAF